MEPWKAFTSKAMSDQCPKEATNEDRTSESQTKGMQRQCNQGYPTNLQWREHERINMSLSTQRHGNLHRSKKILLMLQEVQGGMEIRSTNRGSAWQYASF
jgi:hypothetical protein